MIKIDPEKVTPENLSELRERLQDWSRRYVESDVNLFVGWSSITEKMPEQGRKVLAWDSGFPECVICQYWDDVGWIETQEQCTVSNVSHWMELPSGPRRASTAPETQ